MAAVPNQTLSVRDPGLGIVAEVPENTLFFGASSKGTENVLVYYNTPGDVVDALGQGPLTEDLCTFLSIAGGPALAIKVAHTGNEGAITIGTPARVGTSDGTCVVSASSTQAVGPYDEYAIIFEITVSGDLGDGEFRYTLDNGGNYSASIIIPSGGTFEIPNTGLKCVFASVASDPDFDLGDSFGFTCTANHYDTTQLAAAITVAKESTDSFANVVLCGREASSSDGATMFAAIDVHMTTLENAFKYAGVIMDSGVPELSGDDYDFPTIKAAWVNAISAKSRVAVCFGELTHVSQKSFVGWGLLSRGLVGDVAARIGSVSISNHLGRFSDGPLPGVTAITYDEEKNGQGMSAAGFITTRTYVGPGGLFINKGNLKGPDGSDFVEYARRRIMDVALTTTRSALLKFQNIKIRVLTDGTGRIDPRAAKAIETDVNKALTQNLLVPKDAEGNAGHVADVQYLVNLENDVLGTGKVIGSLGVLPDPYAEEIITELGFVASL